MPSSESNGRRGVSGRPVVAGMMAFGLLASGTLWTYWSYHTAPFIPMQVAIANEFPGSAPRVDGGQRKMHKGTPKLLWVVMQVEFNPVADTVRAHEVTRRVMVLARDNLDLTQFDQLNLRQFYGEPEKQLHRVDFEVPLTNGQPEEPRLVTETAQSMAS